jgi:hypothetical protein
MAMTLMQIKAVRFIELVVCAREQVQAWSALAGPAFAWPVSEVQACEEPDLKEKKGISLNNSTLSRIARAGMNQ